MLLFRLFYRKIRYSNIEGLLRWEYERKKEYNRRNSKK